MSRKSSDKQKNLEETQEVQILKKTSKTLCKLISKADYTISILEKNQRLFIPPYGQILAIKEDVTFEFENDAKFLTFVKY